MTDGYAGSILRVDLSSGEVSKTPLPEELIDKYIGGRGFVAKMLYDELPPDTDPYQVDGLSGATITSRGVTNMLAFWLGETGFGPYLEQYRAARSVTQGGALGARDTAEASPRSGERGARSI